jgi:hypothetical protein
MTELDERIEAIGEQLRAKISSKFQVSAFLAGFAFTILSMQVSALWEEKSKSLLILSMSASLMIAAIVLYIFSIIRLDELTMPKRFWEEDSGKMMNVNASTAWGCLNDQDLWTLKDRMVFYWTYLTLVATMLTVSSILLMLLPISDKYQYKSIAGWVFFFGFLIIGLVSWFYVKYITKRASKMGNLSRPVD